MERANSKQQTKFPSFEDINANNFDFTSRAWSIFEGQVVILENHKGRFAAIKVLTVKLPCRGDGALEVFEYMIYTL